MSRYRRRACVDMKERPWHPVCLNIEVKRFRRLRATAWAKPASGGYHPRPLLETGMDCPRCHGHMAYDNFQDLNNDTGELSFSGWRCMICGEILDELIESNRTNRTSPLQNRNRKFLSSR